MSLFDAHQGSGQPHRLAADNLKRCPLCGALNSEANVECFVCCWHGTFEHDPDIVQAGLAELLDRCPELRDTLDYPSPRRKLSLWTRLLRSIARAFRRRLDLRV